MFVPSVSSDRTSPAMLGLNVGSITPVVASNANIRLRTRSSPVSVNVSAGLTEVNVPPTMTLLPTWVIACTAPFMTCGVPRLGIWETICFP